jgi:bifunctional non-homologous end joining protein LigD
MLASLAEKPFTREGWVYEPKLDGIRAVAYIDNGEVIIKSRGGLVINERFPGIVEGLAQNPSMVIDGEIVALDEEGRPSFQMLQSRGTTSGKAATARRILYYVFDILEDGGKPTVDLPQRERYKLLAKSLKQNKAVKLVEELDCDGETAFEICIKNGLEGVVAKRADAPYQAGRRSSDWIKVKGTQSAEFVICGYSAGTGSRQSTFGSLLVGYYKGKTLHYAGGVGTGFDTALIKSLLAKLQPLVRKTSPFSEKIGGKGKPVWVEPELVAEIKYQEITSDGRLRIPVFMRLRDDIDARQTGPVPPVVAAKILAKKPAKKSAKEPEKEPEKESAEDTAKVLAGTKTSKNGRKMMAQSKLSGKSLAAAKVQSDDVEAIEDALSSGGDNLKLSIGTESINFTHLDKVLWPGEKGKGLTKRDFALYLLAVSPYLLPHLKDRPLTLVRFPNGVGGQKFFQKHWDKNIPGFVDTFDSFAEHAGENHRFLLCDNLATLLWLAQIADLELHTSHARIGKALENKTLTQTYTDTLARIEKSTLNYPDYLVLDLDPYIYSGKEAEGDEPALNKKGFKKACEMALALKDILDGLGMHCFVKTSGRTGLHIYVPLVRNIDYDQVRALAETIGRHLLADHPKIITMDWAVKKRGGKIFFDHNMNARGKTLASIYSPRMSDTGTVSTPVAWDELSSVYPEQFTIKTVPARLAKIGDLWSDILDYKTDVKKLIDK